MQTGHFWDCRTRLGNGLGPRLDPPKKRPCTTLVRLVGCMTNTGSPVSIMLFDWDTFRSDVFLLKWQSVTTGILKPQGAVSQALNLFRGVGFIAWCPSLGECRRARDIFGTARRVLAKTALCHSWVPLSYGLVPHLSKKLSKLPLWYAWRGVRQIPTHPLVRSQSNKGRLEAVRPPTSAGPPSGGRAAL